MKSFNGKEALKMLCIDDELLKSLRSMSVRGAQAEEMIQFLRASGVPKGGAVLALRLAEVMPESETKSAVHFSEAYAFRREADEAFEESVAHAMAEIERTEAA